jgi:hypothetical protein
MAVDNRLAQLCDGLRTESPDRARDRQSELGMPWNIVRGVGVIARAIGLVGHVREELNNPLAREIKTRTEEEATSHLR